MLIHLCVMLLTHPTGCRPSGELGTHLAFGEPAWLDCQCSSLTCQPHSLVRACSTLILGTREVPWPFKMQTLPVSSHLSALFEAFLPLFALSWPWFHQLIEPILSGSWMNGGRYPGADSAGETGPWLAKLSFWHRMSCAAHQPGLSWVSLWCWCSWEQSDSAVGFLLFREAATCKHQQ